MWWFISGYALVATAFYSYITVTAKQDPYEAMAEMAAGSMDYLNEDVRKVA